MDTNTDEQDSIYSRASREEIEEALRWLEELSDKNLTSATEEAKPAQAPLPTIDEGTAKVNPTDQEPELPGTMESPFYGILDATEDDLPEWLREISTTSTMAMLENGEMESRLDWLAKMAKRESIEELPTLEWRRLSGPRHEVPLPQDEAKIITELEPPRSDDPTGTTGQAVSPVEFEVNPMEPLGESLPAETYHATDFVETGESKSFEDLDAAMAWIEELAASQEAPIEDLPSVADRALASKLMVEAGLAATSDEATPLPPTLSQLDELEPPPPYSSDEDPADTIVLMETIAAESDRSIQEVEPELTENETFITADLPSEISEEILESGDETVTETEEEIVAEAILESEADLATEEMVPDEMAETMTEVSGVAESEMPAMTFEEAIAYLEGIAQGQPPTESPEDIVETSLDEPAIVEETVAIELTAAATETEVEEIESDESNPDIMLRDERDRQEELALAGAAVALAVQTIETDDQEIAEPVVTEQSVFITEVEQSLVMEQNGTGHYPLEVKLLALDALALPAGKRLDDIGSNLHPRQSATFMPDDLLSALDWLETAIEDIASSADDEPISPALADEDLIQLMPEDPDEALAWLVRLANDELDETPSQPPAPKSAEADRYQTAGDPAHLETEPATVRGISETEDGLDLMEMPEDPDAAMAWLESLAGIETQPEPVSQPEAPVSEVAEEQLVPETAATGPAIETMGRKPAPSRRTPRKVNAGTAWVDLLKPLDKG